MSEKPPLFFKRRGRTLVPMDEGALGALSKLAEGELVRLTIHRPRSVGQMRLYWTMCGLVAANHEQLKDAESVHQTIKLLAGWTDKVAIRSTGELVQVPRSIAFHSMTPDQWDGFFREAKRVVLEDLLPGVQSKALQEEIERIAA